MPRALLTLSLAAVGFAAGCYTERLPPPAYRYPCDGDFDCAEGESCVLGLCEYRCTLQTFATDCPAEGNYLACINGLCANGCEVGTQTCPELMECIDLSELGIDVSSGGGSPFGSSSDVEIGVCGRMCDADTNPCPTGEVCLLGFCATTCDPTEPDICTSGFECSALFGVCAPPGIDTGAPPPSGDTTPPADTGGDTAGGTGAPGTTGGT